MRLGTWWAYRYRASFGSKSVVGPSKSLGNPITKTRSDSLPIKIAASTSNQHDPFALWSQSSVSCPVLIFLSIGGLRDACRGEQPGFAKLASFSPYRPTPLRRKTGYLLRSYLSTQASSVPKQYRVRHLLEGNCTEVLYCGPFAGRMGGMYHVTRVYPGVVRSADASVSAHRGLSCHRHRSFHARRSECI